MAKKLVEIKEAIDRFQMERARELIAAELERNPSAEAYFLAAQAALSHGQRIEYLRMALDMDPDFQQARAELAQIAPAPTPEPEPDPPAAAPLPKPAPVMRPARLASVGKRWLAIIIDGLIVAVMTLLLVGVSGAFAIIESALLADDTTMISAAVSQFQNEVLRMNLLVSALYNVAFMVLFKGQTMGKIMLKLRVIKKNGQRIGILDAIVRNVFGYTISGMFLLGYVWAMLDRENQTWHDKLAGTLVIDERA